MRHRVHPKLRHKLLDVVAVIITTLLCTGVLVIVKMESILNTLERIESNTLTHLVTTDQLIQYVNELSAEHEPPNIDRPGHEDAVRAISISLNNTMTDLLESPILTGDDSVAEHRLIAHCQLMQESINRHDLDPGDMNTDHAETIHRHAFQIQVAANAVMRSANEFSTGERMAAIRQFRWALAGIAIVFLVILDVLLVVLIRTYSSILKPVNTLIEAGARITQKASGSRVSLNHQDEFDDLEQIFNTLADQIDTNEHKMVDTVHQVARALSHELNNAITIVDLQLSCVERLPGVDETRVAEHMEEIHRAMLRVSAVVATLSRVQRIVLTDYLSGVQMLDLQQSTTEGGSSDAQAQR